MASPNSRSRGSATSSAAIRIAARRQRSVLDRRGVLRAGRLQPRRSSSSNEVLLKYPQGERGAGRFAGVGDRVLHLGRQDRRQAGVAEADQRPSELRRGAHRPAASSRRSRTEVSPPRRTAMLLVRHLAHVEVSARPRVVASGGFDGVHRGHQRVLGRLSAVARTRRAEAVVAVRPRSRSTHARPICAQQLALLSDWSVDSVVLLGAGDPTDEGMVAERLDATVLVTGGAPTFTGGEVDSVERVIEDGEPLSADLVRARLAAGDLAAVERALGPVSCGRGTGGAWLSSGRDDRHPDGEPARAPSGAPAGRRVRRARAPSRARAERRRQHRLQPDLRQRDALGRDARARLRRQPLRRAPRGRLRCPAPRRREVREHRRARRAGSARTSPRRERRCRRAAMGAEPTRHTWIGGRRRMRAFGSTASSPNARCSARARRCTA